MLGRSVLRAFGIALLVAAMGASSFGDPAMAAATPSSIFQPGPDSACSHVGGTYLGDLKCQMPDGSIGANSIYGPVDANIKTSEIPVSPRSPQAWALATTAIMFELNGTRHDLLGGAVALPENAEWARQLLSKWWGVSNRDQLMETLSWLQFERTSRRFRRAWPAAGRNE